MDVSCILESCYCSYSSLYFFSLLSLQFSHITTFRHTFLRKCEASKVETVYCCCLFVPFISSFFFLSNFQTLKFFVTLFSGRVRPRRLKFCTHVASGQMYRAYRFPVTNMLLHICPFISSFFFLFNFQTLKCFVKLFSGTVRP